MPLDFRSALLMYPFTIRVRLTLWYVLLLGIVLALFSGILYLLLDYGLDNQVDDQLRQSAEQALGAVKYENGRLQVQVVEGESELSPVGERGQLVRVLTLDGQVLESAGPFSSLPVRQEALSSALQDRSSFSNLTTRDDIPVRIYTSPFVEGGRVYGAVQVGISLKQTQDTLHQLFLVLALVVPGTLILASAGGLFLANRALSPIINITQTAQHISAHDLGQRLNLALPDDELGRLARTFDSMLARLDEAFQRQHRFTADASHEMRTPLAIMKGSIGVALNRSRQPEEYRQVLGEVEGEVDRLTRLVEDLLLLARADTGQPLLHAEPLDLVGLLQVVVERTQTLAGKKEITIDLKVPEALMLDGDPDKLVRLFLNILDNAIKYTPSNGSVAVCGREESADWIIVEVADSGPGIAPNQLVQIFERFYRADISRSRGTEQSGSGGFGLGLSMARWIAEAHGGSIEAQSVEGEGSIFTVRLPKLIS